MSYSEDHKGCWPMANPDLKSVRQKKQPCVMCSEHKDKQPQGPVYERGQNEEEKNTGEKNTKRK